MTQPLLTIAIPTYNRAQQLDRQLEWAVNAIGDRWDDIELIVSDNASPDETPRICQNWRQRSGNRIGVFRQSSNLGLVRSALFCIEQAHGAYVWLVSDDDRIASHTLNYVLERLAGEQRLSFLHLNGNKATPDGSIIREGVYPFKRDLISESGVTLFQQCVDIYEDWLMLITANIYATAAARSAIQAWPGLADNMAFPLYLAGYAAARGAVRVCADICLTYNWAYQRSNWIQITFQDVPEVYFRLLQAGLPPGFIRRRIMMRISLLAFAMRFPLNFLKSLPLYIRGARIPKG
ncbi:MAG: glycosyltransferase family 2 protein [Thermoflexales bacterium]